MWPPAVRSAALAAVVGCAGLVLPASALAQAGEDVDPANVRWNGLSRLLTLAEASGVASEVASKLRGQVPADLGIPIRLVLGYKTDHPLIITRDESGRIRLSGDLRQLDSILADTRFTISKEDAAMMTSSEAQALSIATELVNRVVTRKLDVTVGSDDATGASP